MFTLRVKDKYYILLAAVFGAFTLAWIALQIGYEPLGFNKEHFSDSYWVLPAIGAILGLKVSRKWGGFRSVVGRSTLFFSLGLFAQVFGQIVYAYYANILGTEAPYPSLGDIGYFGSIPLYIYAVYLLGKSAGITFSLRKASNKLIAILLPVALLAASYGIFLRDYEFDLSSPFKVFLDFGYPLGQSIYIALALLVYLLSRGILGGIMKRIVMLIIVALVLQYASDFMFLYQINNETWNPGEINDYLYLVSYFVISVAMLQLKQTFEQLQGGPTGPTTKEVISE